MGAACAAVVPSCAPTASGECSGHGTFDIDCSCNSNGNFIGQICETSCEYSDDDGCWFEDGSYDVDDDATIADDLT